MYVTQLFTFYWRHALYLDSDISSMKTPFNLGLFLHREKKLGSKGFGLQSFYFGGFVVFFFPLVINREPGPPKLEEYG